MHPHFLQTKSTETTTTRKKKKKVREKVGKWVGFAIARRGLLFYYLNDRLQRTENKTKKKNHSYLTDGVILTPM